MTSGDRITTAQEAVTDKTEVTMTVTDTVETIQTPSSTSPTTETPIKKTTTSEAPQHNSNESLDADALEDLFKDAAELIL